MSAISSTALSGLTAADFQLQSSAHNIANLQTPAFHRQLVQQAARPEGGVTVTLSQASVPGDDLAADVVQQIEAGVTYRANVAVLRTETQMLGSLLDEQA